MGRVKLEEETRRLRAEAERERAAAVEEQEKKLKAQFAKRETMLLEDKKAEIARLRAAWSKHTQESIRAVEERCARELAASLASLKADLAAATAAESKARAYVNVAVQADCSLSTHVSPHGAVGVSSHSQTDLCMEAKASQTDASLEHSERDIRIPCVHAAGQECEAAPALPLPLPEPCSLFVSPLKCCDQPVSPPSATNAAAVAQETIAIVL